jgi:acyl-coenzyme A thioesterase PaaI-like protein
MTDDQPPEPMFRPSSWLASAPLDGQRLAWHRLSASLRQINEALMDMDATEADLLAAAERAELFAANLETTRKGRQHWGFAESSVAGSPRGMLDRSPIIGLGNPVAPPLTFEVEGDHVVGRGSFGLQYEGPPGCVHGGFVAAAFDEVLGMAQSLTGKTGMTGTLTVRYRRPTPLHQDLRFVARVDRVEGRKIFASSTLHHGEMLCAESEGIFISTDFELFAQRQAQAKAESEDPQ